MKYRNKEIVNPTIEQIEEYVYRKKLKISPNEIYDYWNKKNWMTKKGEKIKTLEAAVSVYNGLFINKLRKEKKEIKKELNAEKEQNKLMQEELCGNIYDIYSDGSCDNVNTKVGGSGYVILKDNAVIKMQNKGFYPTTNNRMEMLAIISALNSLPEGSSARVFTDSKYCITVFDGRTHKKNQDLIQLFMKVRKNLDYVVFNWVKGHNGNEYNEIADELAFSAYKEMSEKLGKPISKMMLRTH